MLRFRRPVRALSSLLPEGEPLPFDVWIARHRWIVALLWAHVPALALLGVLRGNGLGHTFVEVLPMAVLAWASSLNRLDQRSRSCLASLGLIVASAVLVHLGGGSIEMHFHFFVMLPVISLYQEWRPFLFAIGFVTVHHGTVGILSPEDVYNHPSAQEQPLLWALIHAAFVLAESMVCVLSWRIIEDSNRASQAELEFSERRFRALVEHATDVVCVFDPGGEIHYASSSITRVLGYGAADCVGTNFTDSIHEEDAARFTEVVGQVIDQGGVISGIELRVRHSNGSYRWIEVFITNLLNDPAIAGIVGNFRDVTERKVLEHDLSHQAFHDTLTGLPNRALLLDRIEHGLAGSAGRPGGQLGLLFLDLDDFKTVNDGLGHEAGDEILRITATRIASVLRPGDTASRLGGDEFAIVLEGIPDPAVAYEVGARLLEAVCLPIEIEGGLLAVHASLGIAVSDGSEDAAGLLRNADLAMYRAKTSGKGRFEIYEAAMHATVLERLALKADLRRAVENDEFEPYYQPIVDLASGAVTGVEALVRWNHPTKGLIPPNAFIPLAEETGLVIDIGSRVLRRACTDAAQWRADLHDQAPQTLSVNLSPRQIQQHDIVAEVREVLAATGFPAGCLTLEITEGVLLEETEAVTATLAGLKALGTRIALDDFGTGYSSLSYLDQFPVDIVKIDKSFIDSLGINASPPSPLVSAIVNLGAVLGLGVTAEGIEDADQLTRLKAMGCASGQGYYFAKPMCGAAIHEMMAARSPADADLQP